MKKMYFLLIIFLLFLTGCENREEQVKSQYIAIKSNLLNTADYADELPLDITVKIDRTDEEVVTYQVILDNPKENMHNLKAMVIHNYYNEDVFPSVGVFNETKELLTGIDNQTIKIKDTIKTTKDISELDLELKIWIEYINDNNEKKDIYYRT